MEAENWNGVIELLTNAAWTSQDLEEKHGVRRSIELFLRLVISQSNSILYNLTDHLKRSIFRGHSFFILKLPLPCLEINRS